MPATRLAASLLAIAGTADDDAKVTSRSKDRLRGIDAEGGVVVEGVVFVGAVVDHFIASVGEVLLQVLLELVPGVVRGDVDAHAPIMPHRTRPERNDPAGVGPRP
ncbi:hypothetical protein GCM10025876_30250 [Demequina litorisediminis]|uniref:Secreted protein n=1 Tax=Demequina litorisediminis TaxID=1849022 RepID=A0ABQ6IGG6_9MICO|nr:hypothetical protein GCM10025876_30250 [Demequina litorisediminis]